jgi:hypothetical protein
MFQAAILDALISTMVTFIWGHFWVITAMVVASNVACANATDGFMAIFNTI